MSGNGGNSHMRPAATLDDYVSTERAKREIYIDSTVDTILMELGKKIANEDVGENGTIEYVYAICLSVNRGSATLGEIGRRVLVKCDDHKASFSLTESSITVTINR